MGREGKLCRRKGGGHGKGGGGGGGSGPVACGADTAGGKRLEGEAEGREEVKTTKEELCNDTIDAIKQIVHSLSKMEP